jgi:UDP-N-acetylmuramoyl-L-alanyl-D-glutamate--2,6-diaminopimelate ligase
MDAYAKAKSLLFANGRVKKAVINLDDEFSALMLSSCSGGTEVVTFSTSRTDADICASDICLDQQGLRAHIRTPWGNGVLETPQLGRFSLENLLAVLGAVCAQGYGLKRVLGLISELSTVPGRMQRMGGDDKPMAVVDYAHTPDALASVLGALKEHGAARRICVFGCGGDRDKGKRPLMAKAAMEGAHKVVITSDNPRSEQPEAIIGDALAGIDVKHRDQVVTITDRSEAIQQSIFSAEVGDIVVIAGKGHEDYQEINGQRIHFDDCEQAARALELWSGKRLGKQVAGGES